KQDAEGDSGHHEQAAPLVALSMLDSIGRAAEIFDRRAQVLPHVLVRGDADGLAADAARPHQLVVDAAGRKERALQLFAKLLVPDRALDVRLHVGDSVSCLRHTSVPFARFAVLYPVETNR